ncbi:unnamed protein product [Diatraea saccharalis]|uniref:Ig-like domain-containing protein n=1 Tax=Diatraea saccharalis TaxID=40085 RepID=A0A9N9WJU0_9NEOP|nr:unnamed protein product [Diatraea saccharalis]
MELLYFAIGLLFISNGAPANAQIDTDEGEPYLVYYDINRNLTLNCSMLSADTTLSYVWKKNDVSLEQVTELKGRYKLEEGGAVFTLTARANEEDYGNYTCALGADDRSWQVHGRPVVRLPDNTNVVEGQKIKLQCKVTPPDVHSQYPLYFIPLDRRKLKSL